MDYVAAYLEAPEAFRVGMSAIHDGAASLIDAIKVAMTDPPSKSLTSLPDVTRLLGGGGLHLVAEDPTTTSRLSIALRAKIPHQLVSRIYPSTTAHKAAQVAAAA